MNIMIHNASCATHYVSASQISSQKSNPPPGLSNLSMLHKLSSEIWVSEKSKAQNKQMITVLI